MARCREEAVEFCDIGAFGARSYGPVERSRRREPESSNAVYLEDDASVRDPVSRTHTYGGDRAGRLPGQDLGPGNNRHRDHDWALVRDGPGGGLYQQRCFFAGRGGKPALLEGEQSAGDHRENGYSRN